GGDGALRIVKANEDLIRSGRFNQGRSGLVAVPDLDGHSHRLAQFRDRNQVDAMRAERARIEFFVLADDDLASVSLDLEDIKWRASSDAETLALSHREIVNAGVFADDAPVGSHHLA